jgi:transposase
MILEDAENAVSHVMRVLLSQLKTRLEGIQEEIDEITAQIERIASQDAQAQMLRTIPGVGPLGSDCARCRGRQWCSFWPCT